MVVIMRKKTKLVYGVGINDADYQLAKLAGEKQEVCPYYQRWKDMLKRCYSKNYQMNRMSYENARVCDDWLTFTNFKSWMILQDWGGNHLDKDLLVMGNKIYSKDFCVFIDSKINNFILDKASARGMWPIGVYFNNRDKKFIAQCSNPFTKKQENLGYFTCPNQAHETWRRRKHELACQLADLQTDYRVSEALRTRYLNG